MPANLHEESASVALLDGLIVEYHESHIWLWQKSCDSCIRRHHREPSSKEA